MRRKNGTTFSTTYLYKTPSVRSYQSGLEKYIIEKYKDLIINNKELFDNKKFYTEFTYELSSRYNKKRDLSNFKKLIEDSLVRSVKSILKTTKFDDSLIFKSTDEKIIRTDIDNEIINIKVGLL
jgi:hypothetical protein